MEITLDFLRAGSQTSSKQALLRQVVARRENCNLDVAACVYCWCLGNSRDSPGIAILCGLFG